jgi:transcription elongation factor Elf1
MIYVKGEMPSGEVVQVQILETGIFCKCPMCGAEAHVEYDVFVTIVDAGELEETEVFCGPCSSKYRTDKPQLTRIK